MQQVRPVHSPARPAPLTRQTETCRVDGVDMPDQDEDIQEAIAVVLSFVSAMNDWETRRHYRSRVDDGHKFTAERDAQLAGDLTAEELDAQYYLHFQEHCTPRKRAYGGHPTSFCEGGAYAGITEATLTELSHPQPRRIEISCAGGSFPNQQYKFILFKKAGKWLIDNAFSRIGGDDWDRAYL